jgi:predicted RNA-binding protein with PUA-like domain
MSYWLLKTEPSTYSWDDLAREKKATWDGISNAAALKNIRGMKKGDVAFVYHTGDERAIIGVAEIVSNPRGEPAVVDIKPLKKLSRTVTLDEIKSDAAFAGWDLLRIGRLSVVPVPSAMWRRVESLAKS